MNVFCKVTLAALKKNKTRTVATIIGIILSAAMICALTSAVSSVRSFLLDYTVYNNGDWHGGFEHADQSVIDSLKASEKIEKLTYAGKVGYAFAEGSANPNKPYIYILGTSDNFKDMMPIRLTGGNYPVTSNEILLPDHLLNNGGVSYKVGDTLTLDIGNRVSDGYVLTQENPYQNTVTDDAESETLEIFETRTYTVVGFYERPGFENYSAPGYTAITFDPSLSADSYEVYFKLHNAGDYFRFIKGQEGSVITNTDLLMFSGVAEFPEFYIVLYGVTAILLALILFGAISLIYNAFSISVSERTKQFGLMSSLGATKKQIGKMVFFEALMLSAVGIPLGILTGIGGLALTFALLGDMFVNIGIPAGVPLRLSVSWQAILVACVIALLTVLVSALIPAIRATRTNAIDAIRQSKDIKISGKDVNTSKLTYKLFGLPGVIASKHFKRNRRKYRTTVISLFMSIVLFISSSAFVFYMQEIVEFNYGTLGYDIIYFSDPISDDKKVDELLSSLKGAEGVTDGTYFRQHSCYVESDRKSLTEGYLNDYIANFHDPEAESRGKAVYLASLMFVQDAEYLRIVKENGLNEKDFTDASNPKAIVYNRYFTYSDAEKKFVNGNVLVPGTSELAYEYEKEIEGYYVADRYTDANGNEICRLEHFTNENDTYTVPADEIYQSGTFKIGALIEKTPYFVEESSVPVLIYPVSAAKKLISLDGQNSNLNFVFRSSDHVSSYNALEKILLANGLSSTYLSDYAAMVEENRNMMTVINVFAYGFIALISLIAATNVFNTISTSVALRRREFAMLRSVGMTSKEFNKMMNYECLLYGLKSLALGLPVSIGITFIIYLVLSEAIKTTFHLPWAAIGIAVLSVFLVVFVTMIYSMRKIKKENTIDSLKNDNL